jgi:hypothetical protein
MIAAGAEILAAEIARFQGLHNGGAWFSTIVTEHDRPAV